MIFRTKWSLVVEQAKDGFDVAGYGEKAPVVGIIPPMGDSTEKGAGPISGDFVTRVGESVAEKLGVFLASLFDTEVVNDE